MQGHEEKYEVRASTIDPTQHALKVKILYLCLVREENLRSWLII